MLLFLNDLLFAYFCFSKKKDFMQLYTREEMSEIANKEGFLFVETSNGDNYEIRKSDVADFIVLEAERCGHAVDIKMYVPNYEIEEPFVSTYGCFLNKINPTFREEIIERLIKLQTTNTKPRKVKVFDNGIFEKMTLEELDKDINKKVFIRKIDDGSLDLDYVIINNTKERISMNWR
mgnify:CR=1 FL=1